MHTLISAVCVVLFGAWLPPASAQADREAPANLQGTWSAIRAVREGKAAGDVMGNQLSIAGNRFEIKAKDGKRLHAGTVRADPEARPAVIDFEHAEGALKGRVWKGIYLLDGETLTVCENAPDPRKERPAAFEAKAGSGYVLLKFERAKR